MSVPAQDDDSDSLLSAALDDNEMLMREIYRLRGGMKQIVVEQWGDISEPVERAIRALLFGTGEEILSPP
jgi:hypothetical protein